MLAGNCHPDLAGWKFRIRRVEPELPLADDEERADYREDDKGLVGIRSKMGHRYLFTDFHWDTGPPFGTANPLVLIVKCPIGDLDEGHIDHAAKQYHENQRLFQWIEEQAAILGITPESE